MEAHAIFQDVLRRIENSKLNYSLSKTPFSASISLKCSLIKRYQDDSQEDDFSNSLKYRNNIEVCDEVNKFETENIKLRRELEKLKAVQEDDHKRLLKETVQVQKMYELEKVKTKTLEKDLSEFREEVLKVRKEKHKLVDILKMKEEDCQNMRMKAESMDAEIIELKKKLKTLVKLLRQNILISLKVNVN